MTLEVCEVDQEVVVGEIGAYEIILYVGGVAHGQFYLSGSIHYVDIGNVKESVFTSRFEMLLGIGATAAVSCVALNDCAVDFLHKALDQFGLQVVVTSGFARADFNRYFAVSLAAYCLVYFHE